MTYFPALAYYEKSREKFSIPAGGPKREVKTHTLEFGTNFDMSYEYIKFVEESKNDPPKRFIRCGDSDSAQKI